MQILQGRVWVFAWNLFPCSCIKQQPRRNASIRPSPSSTAVFIGAQRPPPSSTAVFIALNVLAKCFTDGAEAERLASKLKEIIPSYGEPLIDDADLTRRIRPETARVLNLEYV
jgi:Malate:quinone oxidoreductase (Mqo)